MSRATLRNGDKESGKLIDLMVEYAGRLQTLVQEAEQYNLARETAKSPRLHDEKLDMLLHHVTYLSPAIDALSRYVSQIIEHGNVDDLTRLEYRLRLADLEHAKIATSQILAVARDG